jgi:ABC-2 type transport system ATP-binding protein
VSRFHSTDGRAEDRANMMHGSAPAPPVALAVEGVSYSYGTRQALAEVTFSIAAATFAVLLGLNGAGKTTLFSLITRLYGTQRGRISILGHDVARTPGDALRLIGVVFQSRTLDLDLSVMQNLIYHAALHGIGRRAARRRASEMLDQIDLADRAQDKVRNLSGGQMRRVEIARALLHRPRLLVLDEPTVGLDVKSRADILGQMRRLVAREGTCVLWATHLIDEVSTDDDVIILHHGHVLARGPVARVASDAGAPDIRSAFARLTKISASDAPGEAA